MNKNILVKDVPEKVNLWMEQERRRSGMSQENFILSVLQRACESGQTLPLPFMEAEAPLPGSIPFKSVATSSRT